METGSAPVARERSWRGRLLALAAVLLVVGGIAGSVLAAGAVARHDFDESQQAFVSSSAIVASTLQLAIQHEEDLVVDASAFLLSAPDRSNSSFLEWTKSARTLERYPELQLLGQVVIVAAADMPAFARRAVLDPVGPLGPGGTFAVTPPGARAYYCLAGVSQFRHPAVALPAASDFCQSPLGPLLLKARDSGRGAYVPYKLASETWLAVNTPAYVGGVVPPTVAARRRLFAGWVGTLVDPKVVIDRALRGHPEIAVSLRYEQGASNAAFRSGPAADNATSQLIDLRNGWTVKTFAIVPAGGVLRNPTATTLMIGGIVLSLLLGALGFVLATGRTRALRLVKERTVELRHQALHDALTGLPNRALITDRIDQLLARNRRRGTLPAALFIDLDEFKNVNDTMGHEAGDQLLVAVAARLTSTLRDADTIGRMGGDEFVVLIDGGEPNTAPELVAERLLDVMRQPFDLDGAPNPLIVNTSIGIAVGDRATPSDLLRDADVALYEAKAAGRNRYELFYAAMQTDVLHRMGLEFDLRSALDDDQFCLHYQPIYNLDDLALVGVEALLRWEHPTRGLVQPDEFVPVLEKTGQIRDVGRWVLLQACEQMAAWHARGDTLSLSINVSGRQLDSDDIIANIQDALDSSGLDAASLIIEVTETALMRNAAATATRLQAIKELGVRIAVDDFGTGYSSLAYLQQFPVDCLKIDRAFTSAITTSPESKALIGTLVQLGKDLGLTTLAEGIETTEQIDYLRHHNVDEAQGFLLSRPLDADTLETQLLVPTRHPDSHPSSHP